MDLGSGGHPDIVEAARILPLSIVKLDEAGLPTPA